MLTAATKEMKRKLEEIGYGQKFKSDPNKSEIFKINVNFMYFLLCYILKFGYIFMYFGILKM